jgi:nucleoside-diphosphate-sugar epimerase
MNAFVTGAGGLIGRAVVEQLLKSGHSVTALIRSSRDITYAHSSLRWVLGDIRDPKLLEWMTGSDYVVHLAARTADEADSEEVNVGGTKNVVGSAEKCAVKGIVHISTISTKFKSRGTYGETKLQADSSIQMSKIPAVILRISVVYGDLSSGIFGSLARYARLPFVPLVGPGEATSRPIHVEDVAEAIEKVISRRMTGHTMYELGGPDVVTLNELTRAISWEIKGQKARIVHLPLPLGFFLARIFSFMPKPPITRSNIVGMNEIASVDIEKFCKTYEFKPRSLADGLRAIRKNACTSDDEAKAIMSYVSSGKTSDHYVSLYKKALEKHGLESEKLDPKIFTSTHKLRGLDLLTRFTDSNGSFRKKLAIASAIYEASPLSADALLPRERSMVSIGGALMIAGIKTLVAAIVGIPLILIKGHGSKNV